MGLGPFNISKGDLRSPSISKLVRSYNQHYLLTYLRTLNINEDDINLFGFIGFISVVGGGFIYFL